MGAAGNLRGGEREERVERIVRFIEKHGHVEWRHVASMFGLERCNAILWRNRGRAEFKRRQLLSIRSVKKAFEELRDRVNLHESAVRARAAAATARGAARAA